MRLLAFQTGNFLFSETVSQYADLKVPVVNIVLEGLALILLVGAVVAGILLLRNHVRQWLYPFGIGLVFHLVFRYTLFNQRFGLMRILFGFLAAKVPFLQGQDTLLSIILSVLDVAATILAVFLALAYWKKAVLKDHRPFSLGGAIALGFSAYVVNLIASGYLSQFYGMITNSQMINMNGFDSVLQSYLSQTNGLDREEIIEQLTQLTDSNVWIFIKYLLGALVLIFEGFVPIAVSVLRYGVMSEQLKKKWNYAAVALPVLSIALPLVQTFTDFDFFAYIAIGYSVLVAAVSVWLVIYLSKKYMEKEWSRMGYTRKMQKQDEEKAKNKMPKIEMPKD